MKSTIQSFWTKHLQSDIEKIGGNPGDFPKIQASVLTYLQSVGWADSKGRLSFSSTDDLNSAIDYSLEHAKKVTASVVSARRERETIAASTYGVITASALAPVRSSTFNPQMAKPGDKCPRCKGEMQMVSLVNGRSGMFCTNDHVALPCE